MGPKTKPYLPKRTSLGPQNILVSSTALSCLLLGGKEPHNMSGRQVCWCANSILDGLSVTAGNTVLLWWPVGYIHCDQPWATICGTLLSGNKNLTKATHGLGSLSRKHGGTRVCICRATVTWQSPPSLTGQVSYSQREMLWHHSFLRGEHQQCARWKTILEEKNKTKPPKTQNKKKTQKWIARNGKALGHQIKTAPFLFPTVTPVKFL